MSHGLQEDQAGACDHDDLPQEAGSSVGARIDRLQIAVEQLSRGQGGLTEQLSQIARHLYFDAINWNEFSVEFKRFVMMAEDRQRDALEILLGRSVVKPLHWTVVTEHPVAEDTVDHQFPRGTAQDNTRHPRFVAVCETLFDFPLRHLDIGCAGGGLVWDFARRGHRSIGIEGSDWSKRAQRAEWRTIPDRLFTADVRYPFQVEDEGGRIQQFDVVTAWELLEHIPDWALPTLLQNIARHLAERGLFVASIATFQDTDNDGHEFHPSIHDKDWWTTTFRDAGLIPVDTPFVTADYPRGSDNPRALDWDAARDPHLGFHIVARRLSSDWSA